MLPLAPSPATVEVSCTCCQASPCPLVPPAARVRGPGICFLCGPAFLLDEHGPSSFLVFLVFIALSQSPSLYHCQLKTSMCVIDGGGSDGHKESIGGPPFCYRLS